ncbi:1,4-alpha-glucan branching enzyme [Salipaludibacillus keqinensis]|uniref:1,4-alpha-glucan branching enzyme GlgB n=1 Tax=Salipaludibacillus keqinensis TaxID=2045207 RepID=A0A323TMB4_9BACI|nr:1,4-alpha-glucan branching protein GlgB [Salipaludibacillus keqinensis]PYZ93803.1 1,4-alpha-glucan branching enzyme [Salipaludibacillus keqinensis]
MNYPLSEHDIYLFHQGTHYHSYELLGCHEATWKKEKGFRFTVWAPHASRVSIVGDFNHWTGEDYPLERLNKEGLWVGFFTSIPPGTTYKYSIVHSSGQQILKSDPYARQSELRPATASLTPNEDLYEWKDEEWQQAKANYNPYESPINIYEVHLGTWKKKLGDELYTYRELAQELIPYVKSLGYTHIELMPVAEHPFDLSWGYQITGYFSITSRYGSLNDFKYFVDQCHLQGIGVIMDWVPGHFCKDSHGLRQFDGEPLYEYLDERKAEKTSWGTLTFDFGRPEVQSFLLSNAIYWLKEFHIDGIRVDAVASMIYLNFDKNDGEEKVYNSYGGDEHLEALAFLKKLNQTVFHYFPNTLMMAEDSSDVPLVTSPIHEGGLGFNFKWNMGWMNDMLTYMEHDPLYRKWNHNLLTFSFMYTHSENFVLPLSHDEVVHGKRSLLNKMPGDQWQQFASLRLLFGYMIAHPGKKLLFMGGEIGQYDEWKDKEQLDWHLLDFPLHRNMFDYVTNLNHFYLTEKAFFEKDHDPEGFEWIDPHNIDQSIVAFIRRGNDPEDERIIVCNFTPNVIYDYKVGVPKPGEYKEIFNSDSEEFGGSGQMNREDHFSFSEKWHSFGQHIKIMVPPLAISIFKKNKSEIEEDA